MPDKTSKKLFNAPVELPLEDVGVRVPPLVQPTVLHELLRDDVLIGRPLSPRDEELDHAGVEVVHGQALELPPLVPVALRLPRRVGGGVLARHRGLLAGLERAVLGESLHRLLGLSLDGALGSLAGLLAPGGGGVVDLPALPHGRLPVVNAGELLDRLEVDPLTLLGGIHESQGQRGALELEGLDRPQPDLLLRDPAPGQYRHRKHLAARVAEALVRERQLPALGVAADAARAEVLVGRRRYDLGAGRREDGQVGLPVRQAGELVALLGTLGALASLALSAPPRGGDGSAAPVRVGLALLRGREVEVLDLPEEVVDLRAPRGVAPLRGGVPGLLRRHEVRQADLVAVEGQEGAEDGLVVRAGIGLVVELEPLNVFRLCVSVQKRG